MRRATGIGAAAWRGGELAGGLYGVALGKVFYGESMFHWVSEASGAASLCLAALLKRSGFKLIDCQQTSNFATGMGAEEIPLGRFLIELAVDLAESKKTFILYAPGSAGDREYGANGSLTFSKNRRDINAITAKQGRAYGKSKRYKPSPASPRFSGRILFPDFSCQGRLRRSAPVRAGRGKTGKIP